eukprot:Platyproteum_vivax@DN16216_c0_g1_i3.p1
MGGLSGESKYKLDNETVSEEEYTAALAKEHIIIKAKNFLIFQGEVEQVAQKDPKELTAMFEQISGSEKFAQDYLWYLDAIDAAQDEARVLFTRKRNELAEKTLLKEQKDEAVHFNNLVQKMADMKVQLVVLKLFQAEQECTEQEELIHSLREELDSAAKEATEASTDFKQAEKARAGSKLLAKKKKKKKKKVLCVD